MGIILAKLRKKPTTYEQLEKLDVQIKAIEEYGKTTEITQKKVAGRFVLVSVFVYLVTAIIFYFYFFPATFYERLLYVIPLITAPLIIVSVKRILTWWYNRKIKRNQDKLSTLKEQKKKMLDKVMDTETYKVAKKILETFAPDEVITRKSLNMNYVSPNSENSLALTNTGPTGLRYRGLMPVSGRGSLGSVSNNSQTPSTSLKGGKSLGNLPLTSTPRLSLRTDVPLSSAQTLAVATPRLPMARTILPRERSAFDKLVDYLVGDGPSNRYALICKKCSSHNGMALREEFEYLSFHCCYCHCFNPARKQRPPAPKLGVTRITPPRAITQADTSESEKNSGSDSESETLPLTTLTATNPEVHSDTTEHTSDAPAVEPNVDEPIPAPAPISAPSLEMAVESENDVELMDTSSDKPDEDKERD